MRFRKPRPRLLPPLALLLCLVVPFAARAFAAETPAEHAANVAAQRELDSSPVHGNIPSYALSAADLAKAQAMWPVRACTQIAGVVWPVLTFAILLWSGLAAWMRDRAVAASGGLRERGKMRRAFWLECAVFTLLYTAGTTLFALPLTLARHWLTLHYGLSVQGWLSWTRDFSISLLLLAAVTFFVFALLMRRIRRMPQAWWFVAWLVAVPVSLLFVFLAPFLLDPLYNHFEPLTDTQPVLVERLEQVVAKGHMNIPPERMFLMRASSKVTTMNAYVTGFGASKRVVVWDTSLAKGTPDEVTFIFGHESGHYVLGHIVRGIWMGALGLLAGLYLAARFLPWALCRFGVRWRISDQGDWGALIVLSLAMSLLQVAAEPLQNALTRQSEHAADVYGQEAIHGIVADPQRTAQHAFEVLAASSFEEPNVPQWYALWFYDHPATGRRAAFAANYDPWSAGMQPKYFRGGQN